MINSIIINNNTITDYISELKNIPIFSVNQEIYDKLMPFDISAETDNIFISLYYLRIDYEATSFTAMMLTVSLSVIILSIGILWHIFSIRNNRNEMAIQKTFSIILYMKFILSLLMIYYMYLCYEGITLENKGDSILIIYVQTVLLTISSVLRTLLWFMIIIISSVLVI
jgi:hypothetical protein